MGGTILRYTEVKWTIFSLCRASDADRAPKFKNICKLYGAKSIITNLEDNGIASVEKSIPEIEKLILKNLKTKEFDCIFTHGDNGEYGHPRHRGVRQAVAKLLKTKKLVSSQVFYFAYTGENRGDGSYCSNNHQARYLVKLSPAELAKKRKIIRDLYGFSKESFEYLSCLGEETFC